MKNLILVVLLVVSGCSLPGRQTLAANPVGADTQSIDAAQAFSGRIALVTILPGTTDFAAPLADAVRRALAIKPGARFEVQAQTPVASPDVAAAGLTGLSGTAAAVAQAIVADGVPAGRVSLTAATAGLQAVIAVYVK